MNPFLSMGVGEMWQLGGWTMVHFLWLGALVGVAAAVSRLVLRRASANVRYVVALAWLVVLVALPVGIAAWIGAKPQAVPPAFQAAGVQELPIVELNATPMPVANAPANVVDAPTFAPSATTDLPSKSPTISDLLPQLEPIIAAAARYLPWLWLIGTPLTFLLLTTGVVGAERLRRASRVIDDGPIADACARLRESLRIGRQVTVAVCERIATPVLVGIVRPIILLPPAALTGWSPDEIEMVLLHELAHVRRWDNLVNLAQRIVESLLFFHPAVWLLSSWVRREREACCDALVVRRTNRPHAYAEMLVALAAQMPRSVLFHPTATSAMAAGPLRGRIRRILGLDDDPMLVSGKSLAVALGGLLLAATLAVLNLPTQSQAVETESNGDIGDRQAQEAQTQNNLKDLAIALLNFHEAMKYLPPVAKFDANGKPLLSWRVMVLPYLGQDEANLFKEFHLDEAWDSEHNRRLIGRMPKVFENPKLDRVGMTNYLAVVGPECVFTGAPKGIRIAQISDGTSKTIALVEANADRAVEWTKPQDWEFDRQIPTAGLGSLWKDHWYGAWVDGSVRRVENREAADAVGIQFTRAGREASSLRESEGRVLTQESHGRGSEFGDRYGHADGFADYKEFVGELGMPTAPPRKFPSLEEQKLADVAWKRMGLELEPLGNEDMQRVKMFGYDGGLKVTHGAQGIQWSDILVGLHVWPTRSLQELAEVLNRPDLGELAPLKFYVIRKVSTNDGTMLGAEKDRVITGRINVGVDYVTQPVYAQPIDMPATVSPPISDTPASQPLAPGHNGSIHPSRYGRARLVGNGLVYLFDDEAPSRDVYNTISQMRDEYATLLNIWVVDARLNPEVARALDVSHFPVTVIFKDGKKDALAVGDFSGPNARNMIRTVFGETPTTEPVELAAPETTLRYDGKTFDEWRQLWQTELSTESRLQAVQALAAFGASGKGREAAEAIIEVAGQYDWSSWRFDDNQWNKPLMQLQSICVDAFGGQLGRVGTRIPKQEALEALLAAVDSPNPQTREFVLQVIDNYRFNPPVAAALVKLSRDDDEHVAWRALEAMNQGWLLQPRDVSGQLLERLREELRSNDPNRVRRALQIMINSVAWGNDKPDFPNVPELEPLLFDSDESIRLLGRQAVSKLRPQDAPAMVEELLAVIDDESRSQDRREAVRALAAMGAAAKPAKDRLTELVNGERGDYVLPASVAIYNIEKGDNPEQMPSIQEIIGVKAPEGPMTPQIVDTYLQPEMDKILPDDRRSSGGGMF